MVGEPDGQLHSFITIHHLPFTIYHSVGEPDGQLHSPIAIHHLPFTIYHSFTIYQLRSRLYLHPSALAKRVPTVLLIAVIAFYFYGLSLLPLVGPDEPRYAQVAREMLQRGDLITPTLGGHTWFEKPVLLYWLMMLGYKLFGFTEQAARLGVAAAGVLT